MASDPADCSFHVVNLTQEFAVGLKEKKVRRTKKRKAMNDDVDDDDGSTAVGEDDVDDDECDDTQYVQVGKDAGPFRNGRDLHKEVSPHHLTTCIHLRSTLHLLTCMFSGPGTSVHVLTLGRKNEKAEQHSEPTRNPHH